MFGIGEYTFAPFRVVWKRMANDLVAAVIADWHTPFGMKALLPTDTTAFIPLDNEAEAHYLAAILNSGPVRTYIRSFSSAGRGFGAPAILRYIGIVRFDPADPNHAELSNLGARASQAVASGNSELLTEIEASVDRAVSAAFGFGQSPDTPRDPLNAPLSF